MRRPIKALTAATLVVALAATMIRGQQSSRGTPSATGNDAASSQTSEMNPAMSGRTARSLLRNGTDYLGYQEYARALKYLREAETRQKELSEAEQIQLKTSIEKAMAGLKAPANAGNQRYAKGINKRPGSIALAKPPGQDDQVQLASTRPPQERAEDGSVLPAVPPAEKLMPATVPTVAAASTATTAPTVAVASAATAPVVAAVSNPQPQAYVEPPALPLEPADGLPAPAPVAQSARAPVAVYDVPPPTLEPTPVPQAPVQAAPVEFAAPALLELLPAPAPVVAESTPLEPAPLEPAPLEREMTKVSSEAPVAAANPKTAAPVLTLESPTAIDLDTPLPLPAPDVTPMPPVAVPQVAQRVPTDEATIPVSSMPVASVEEQLPAPSPVPEVDDLPVLPGQSNAGGSIPVRAPAMVENALPEPEPQPEPLPPLPDQPPAGRQAFAEAPSSPNEPGQVPSAADAPLPLEADAMPPLPNNAGTAETPVPVGVPLGGPMNSATQPTEVRRRPSPYRTPLSATAESDNSEFFRPKYTDIETTLTPELSREVERIARAQEDAARQQPGVNALANDFSSTNAPSSKLIVPRAPSPTEARPIKAIPVPEDFKPLEARQWPAQRKFWAAAAVCHAPLYFQDASLERYGHSVETFFGPAGRYMTYPIDDPKQSKQRIQILQPLFSAGLFAGQIAALPYNMIVDPFWEPEYDLGYYRPGDRVPRDVYYLPWHGVGGILGREK